jgi:outer membrane lipoprotein-sorting protein
MDRTILFVCPHGAGKSRLAVTQGASQETVVHDGTTVWDYSSKTNTATKVTIPADVAKQKGAGSEKTPDPVAASTELLAKVRESSTVSVDGTATVAGRPAYELVLTPKPTERTLLREIRVAVDSQTRMPLRVSVLSNGTATPALEVAFTEIEFKQQPADLFTFTPPKGAKVVQQSVPADRPGPASGHAHAKTAPKAPEKGTQNVVGSGWTAVAVLPGVDVAALGQDQTASALLRATSAVTLPNGTSGRLLRTPLVSVLIVGDTAYVGAVDPAVVEQVAATHPTTSTTR